MDVKIFGSRYWETAEKPFWIPVVNELFKRGHKIHQEVKECDHAIILCGGMENPCAFENKTLFYVSKVPYSVNGKITFGVWPNLLKMKFQIPVLKEYYDTLFDMALLAPATIAERIIAYINEINQS